LHKAELDVTGYDVWKGSSDKFAAAGAKTAATAKEACEGAKVVVLMVVNAEQAEGVLFDGGVAAGECSQSSSWSSGRC
jgi:putative dehydrogenase